MTIVLSLILAALAGFYALVYLRQEALLFYPEPLPNGFAFAQPDVQEVQVPVPGAVLSALHLRQANARGVVFFLHGNAGNLADWFVNQEIYRQSRFDLFMIDYRGYGKSTGRIESEAQLHADVDAAWDAIAPLYRGLRVAIYGRSLGTGLAAHLAARIQPDLTILVSPYWSVIDLARRHYPYLPWFLLRYPLRTHRDIGRIRSPILLIHGDRDRLIPYRHSLRLREAVAHAQLVRVAGAAHNDLQDFETYNRALLEALNRLEDPQPRLAA